MQCSHIELADSSTVCFRAMEISAIPDLSITQYSSEADARRATTELIRHTLVEIFQVFKSLKSERRLSDIALEMLWITEPVSNQVFEAKIRIILIFRSIAVDISTGDAAVNTIYKVFQNALDVNRFSIAPIGFRDISFSLQAAGIEQAEALVKECRIDRLQIAALPQCYSYDRFGIESPASELLINSLLHCPNSAVSIQLIPTVFSPEEENLIDGTCQALGMLARGMMSPGWGNVVFESAKQSHDTYSYYNSNRNYALFEYNLVVCGKKKSVAEIASSLKSQLRGETSASMRTIAIPSSVLRFDDNYYPAPWMLQEYITEEYASELPGVSADCIRLPLVITAEEAAPFFTTPIAGPSIHAGFLINESGQINKQYGTGLIDAGDISLGKLKNKSSTIGINLKDITKHMLVAGTPGSGKTTFLVGLLDRLWKNHGIPFLVIEPAKNEYRALVQSIPDLQIFTPGKSAISPFVFNPFVPPKNVRLETYKSVLKTAFSAAVSMTTPLDKIFEETVNNCYSDHKWLDNYTTDDRGIIFNISDFIKCFRQTFAEIGYTGDARNIGRAGEVRLNSLVNLFDNYHSIPIEDMLCKPTVIELAAIENSEQKSLIIALLLLSILSYVNANYIGTGGLKNVVLLEEAHVLLDDSINSSQGDANPSQIAQGLIKRMLAEIRSYGVGLVIADQSPRKVSSDVVALTDLKLIFRLVEAADKRIISDSMNMDASQERRLARLKPGEAFLFFNRLDEPEEVVTPDYRLENNIDITLADGEIARRSTYWKGKERLLRPYPECNYISACNDFCNQRRRELAREIARRLFNKFIKSNAKDFDVVGNVFRHITANVKEELNGEPFSPELLSCVKCQLLRRIKYQTNIPLREIQIQNSLKK